MAKILRQPTNLNISRNVNYKMEFRTLPNFTFFIQSITLPGVTLPIIKVPTRFIDFTEEGEKLDYEQLVCNVLIDEEFRAYTEIYDWMVGLGFPENHQQFEDQKNSSDIVGASGLKDEAVLSVLTNNLNTGLNITFRDIFPTNLSSVEFTSTDSDNTPLIATVTFDFTGPFKIERL